MDHANDGFILESGISAQFGFFQPQSSGPFSTTSISQEYRVTATRCNSFRRNLKVSRLMPGDIFTAPLGVTELLGQDRKQIPLLVVNASS